jgi:hypothetical protein
MAKKKSKDLTTIKDKARNNNKSLIPVDTAEEIVANVLCENKDDRQAKYFLYRICGLSPRISARLCNYNEDYGYRLDRKFRDDLNLRTRIARITNQIPEQYKALCKLRLVDIAEIEGKALAEYKEDPKLAISKPTLIKQLKQGAGVLTEDEIKPAPLVNIKGIRNLMIKVGNRDSNIPQLKCEKPKDMLED